MHLPGSMRLVVSGAVIGAVACLLSREILYGGMAGSEAPRLSRFDWNEDDGQRDSIDGPRP